MNTKQLFAAASLIALTVGTAFAADTAPTSTKTRAEVVAELAQARAAGEQVGGEEFAWFATPQAVIAKTATEPKTETAKAPKAKSSSATE
ncbi:DUF4148 domain-containing protein [Undibacterium sp. Jales W-56]|uniref:DUF4148 domain-containing protein n=1 Tax=Undibacterium sp. Jales W-56 TaxID=2897325 RepID=UPI0021D3741B|nr:DUF4148 domain-containing protein [Undibacterium sp. Jales W-56]MCU6434914.1 DUF4148 domain-containing protein [Undibacterium sp. Jales W-56]